ARKDGMTTMVATGAPADTRSSWLTLENALAALLVLAALAVGFFDPRHQILMTFAGVYLIAAMGLNILTGYVGIISIAHGALVCVGAYTVGIATVNYGIGFW